MPITKANLPNGETVTLVHATTAEGWAGNYFNGKRMGFNGAHALHMYKRSIPQLRSKLTEEVEATGQTFDAVFCPPSSDLDTEPYLTAVLERWNVPDLSSRFTRQGKKKASRGDTTYEDMIEEYVYVPDGSEGTLNSILIVDESFATGKSVAALLYHLRKAGMPPDAKVVVGVCSKML